MVLYIFYSICERISPRLAHANAAVVLSTVKVLMKLVEMLPESSEFIGQLTKKLAPPMVTLLSAEPEIQYVALRNINLIVQKRFFYNNLISKIVTANFIIAFGLKNYKIK